MLKIEVIKFEAQDVITASTPATPKCTCQRGDVHYNRATGTWDHGNCPIDSGTSDYANNRDHNCNDLIN